MGVTESVTLQIIIAISLYCAHNHNVDNKLRNSRACFKVIWECAHKVSDSKAIAFEVHNCIAREMK